VEELIPFVNQSRETFDEGEISNLAKDIQARGLLQPGVAWFDPGRGKYVLICGERRWRAIKKAGQPTMTVKVIKGNLTQGQMLAINLSENLQRANLNTVERAKSFRRLAQLEGITSKQVAERMHVSDATVSRDLAILDLPEDLLSHIVTGRLSSSTAYELTRIDEPQAQRELAQAVLTSRMNRDQVAAAVRNRDGQEKKTRSNGDRRSFKLKGGVSVTVVKSGQALTEADLTSAIERLRRVLQELKTLDKAGETAELAQVS
jgi:ParB family transcriptional regulator, chromosome partitioning protein